MNRVFRTAAAGAVSGAAATVAMSAVMYTAQGLGLLGRAPPRQIVERALASIGLRGKVPSSAKRMLTALAHLGFGATQGALYALLQEAAASRHPALRAPSVASGVPFALSVWATSYAGWIPTLGILPRPSHDRPGRPATMVLSHIVYGVALSKILRRAEKLALAGGAS